MRTSLLSKTGRKGSTMVLFTLMLPTMLIPIAGLGIDATMLYIVQAKLSAAVDGASLGAGRLLGTQASPSEIAGEFLHANFPASGTPGFWGAYNVVPSISVTLGTTKTIHVSATADVPLLFSRIFGYPKATVSAAAVATRRDSRVILVIDRSGSMNTADDGAHGPLVITDVVNFAQGFTQDFTAGVDEVGLVVFDASAVVGYPTTMPWDPTTTSASTGGPDTNFLSGSTTDMVHQIQRVNASNGTGMADALSVAYIELQKAHMRDLAAKGVDDKLNSIVLFTDGVPSAVSLWVNNSADSALARTSNCTYRTTNASSHPMYGWLALGGKPPYGSSSGGFGFSLLATLDQTAGHTAQWWMSNAGQDQATPQPQNFGGCKSDIVNSSSFNYGYLSQIPHWDKYGNDLRGDGDDGLDANGYTHSHIVNGATGSIYNGTAFRASQVSDQYQWGLAMWNAADDAAYRIRSDVNLPNRPGDTTNMSTAIFAIGYTGNGGTDDGLLKRIANDKSASNYNTDQPTGLYVQASDSASLSTAFATIASAILRLAQ